MGMLHDGARQSHVVSLRQAYPSQREGTVSSPSDTTEYAARHQPHLQMCRTLAPCRNRSQTVDMTACGGLSLGAPTPPPPDIISGIPTQGSKKGRGLA